MSLLRLRRLVKRKLIRAAFAQPHERLVCGDTHQPGIKAGVFLKILEVRVRLEESVLHGVLGVFAIPRDVHGQAEDFRFVAVYQFFESMHVAALGGSHQQMLVVAGDAGRQNGGDWLRSMASAARWGAASSLSHL